jgi:hypothetical protein
VFACLLPGNEARSVFVASLRRCDKWDRGDKLHQCGPGAAGRRSKPVP